jgi:DNA-binding transcriptional LysR family regulator
MPSLKKFLDLHPNIELELIVGQHLENLGRREADVVLRATNNPPETYVGRCVAKHAFPIYAARDVVAQFGPDSPLDAYPWIAWEDGFTQHWMQKNVPNARIVFRANTAFGVGEALRTGIGIAHYACFGADLDPTLVRLRPPETDLDLDIWLLTHTDQRHIPRIQTFMAFMTEEIQVQRDLIEGRLGG